MFTLIPSYSYYLFYEQQHGFLPRMSCAIELLHKMEHWIKNLDDGNDVDIVYLVRHLTVFHTNMYCLS